MQDCRHHIAHNELQEFKPQRKGNSLEEPTDVYSGGQEPNLYLLLEATIMTRSPSWTPIALSFSALFVISLPLK
jgi:hypothetical protein